MPIRKPKTVNAPYASTFGAKMQEIRKKKGLTQADLADKLGVSVRKITYYERFSKNPSTQFVEAVANALSVPTKVLLNEKEVANVEEIPAVIKSLKQKLPMLAQLPRQDQEALVAIIDGLLVKRKIA